MPKEKKCDTVIINENGDVLPNPLTGAMPAAVPVFFRAAYHVPLITKLAREGMSIAEIAEQCGITVKHLAIWRQRFKVVDHVITEGHLAAQVLIENKLYEMALGLHQWDEVTTIEGADKDGKNGYVQTKKVTKRMKPSVEAQIFILKNVAPDKWKDRQEIKSEQELKIVWNEYRMELTAAERQAIKALPPYKEGEQNGIEVESVDL